MSEPQIYHPYTDWEDWLAVMWQPPLDEEKEGSEAARILRDAGEFRVIARAMLLAWPIAAEQNLTDLSQNGRAWIGQAACCYASGVRGQSTRHAWWTLSSQEQSAANAVADQVCSEWESRRRKHRQPSLFDDEENG